MNTSDLVAIKPLMLYGGGPAAALCHLGILWFWADVGLLTESRDRIDSDNYFTKSIVLPIVSASDDREAARDFCIYVASHLRERLPRWRWTWTKSTPVAVRIELDRRTIIVSCDGKLQVETTKGSILLFAEPTNEGAIVIRKIQALLESKRVLDEIERDYLIDWSYVLCDQAFGFSGITRQSPGRSVSPNRLFYRSVFPRVFKAKSTSKETDAPVLFTPSIGAPSASDEVA